MFSFFDALGKNNGSCTFESAGCKLPLFDNCRLAWHWQYQYLRKLPHNYVWRERNLALQLLCWIASNFLSVVGEAFDSPPCGNLLSRSPDVCIHHVGIVV